MVKNSLVMQEPWVGKIPWKKERLRTPVLWPGGGLYSPWGHKESDMTDRLFAMHETWVCPLLKKIPWRRKWQPTEVFFPGKSQGQRNLDRKSVV